MRGVHTFFFYANVILAVMLMFAPLPLGSNRPAFEAILNIFAALALILFGFGQFKNKATRDQKDRFFNLLAALFMIFFIWCMIQSIWFSIDPFVSVTALGQLVSGGIVFYLCYHASNQRRDRTMIIKALSYSSIAYAAYGLVVYMLGNSTILWLNKWTYEDSLTATFVNRNAFAAYCGLGMLATATLIVQEVEKIFHRTSRIKPDVHYVLDHLTFSGWVEVFGFMLLTMVAILSDSRAGFLSIGVALAFFLLALMQRFKQSHLMFLVLILGGVGLGLMMILLLGQGWLDRFDASVWQRDERIKIWSATLQMIAERPWQGWGLNSYADVFLMFRSDNIAHHYQHAHSVYLEHMVENGIIAAVIWFLLFSLVFLRAWRSWKNANEGAYCALFASCALVQAGLHSLVDFSFQFPANALIFSAVLGLGFGQRNLAEKSLRSR